MRTAPGTVLFATAGFRRKPQADGTRIVGVLGDLVGGSLMALAVPHRLPGVGVHIAHLLEITGPRRSVRRFDSEPATLVSCETVEDKDVVSSAPQR